jgi:serine phosphatase RsbU (regulator of sigma subunit)/anti-sigma regulatory factor (Ser/Thr protein kinase)/DNA-binding NarL/FixJ family response regulator
MPPLRVMLIEDDRTYACLVEEMLAAAFAGERVEVACFGSLAAATEQTRSADCALVDLSLPERDGLGGIDELLVALPEVPVVVLTEGDDEVFALHAVEHGAQDCLGKRRIDPQVLGRSVRYAIERKRAELQRAELLRARAAHAEAEALSGMLARLQGVADAAMAVHGELDHDELLARSLAVIAADCGAMIVQAGAGAAPTIAAARGLARVGEGTAVEDSGVTADVLASEEPLVVDRVRADDTSTLGAGAGVGSLVAVPLQADGRYLGVLVATSALPARFTQGQARLLALAGERCSRALANAAAYERERRIAAALQAGLLPQGVPTLRHGEIAVRYLPASGGPTAVGGDWYDAIQLPDGRLGVAIGDVAGHGAEAAVLMGQLRTALRAYAFEGSAPGIVVSRLNALALSLGEDAMATLIYAVLDGTLTSGSFVSAGHPPPIRVSAAGADPLIRRSSPPVGASGYSTFVEHEFTLRAGDALCLYSDGLVEERGTNLPDRELALLQALGRPAAAEVLCERALAALRPHGPAEDDVALLVLQTSEARHGLRSIHAAHADELGPARAALRAWLEAHDAGPVEISEMLLAANEACMNVIEHAYDDDGREGTFTLEGHLDGHTVVLIVRDAGRWSEVRSRGRGRGLKLMEALMDSVQLSFSSEGTIVVLRRTLETAR